MIYSIIDAFTDQPFGGNPAAVVLLEDAFPNDYLQRIAAEFNLSETAFLRPMGNGYWSLRWFTPVKEVELCGHATLASAHALWNEWKISDDELSFATLSGELKARRGSLNNDEGPSIKVIKLDFPVEDTRTSQLPKNCLNKLQLSTVAVVQGGKKLLVELPSPELVRDYRPDSLLISQLPYNGLIITAKNDSEELRVFGQKADFVSRFFAPALGIPEDPVTGSAHCLLGCYWQHKLNRSHFFAKQISSRGGELYLEIQGERIQISGQAVTVMSGELQKRR